ncbi:MAG: hypothetical protein ACRECX_12875 [Methyloceanibacter sp.]|uniref:hypothetical protein n=1 Tax=Methyloceanibacter sp. TaxID=1965321 RepID=UPI003D6D471E
MVSEANDIEQALRQNLKLRRQLGAAVAKAKNSPIESGGLLPAAAVEESSGSAVEEAHPASDELNQLRMDLNHRRGLDAPAAAQRVADYRDQPRALDGSEESLAARVMWQAWIAVGMTSLALAVVIALWLIYA